MAICRIAPGLGAKPFPGRFRKPGLRQGQPVILDLVQRRDHRLAPQVTSIRERDVRPSARQTGQSVRMRMIASSWVCHLRRRACRAGRRAHDCRARSCASCEIIGMLDRTTSLRQPSSSCIRVIETTGGFRFPVNDKCLAGGVPKPSSQFISSSASAWADKAGRLAISAPM